MALTNPNNIVTEQRLSDFYQAIYPYLGGSGCGGGSIESIYHSEVYSSTITLSKGISNFDSIIINGYYVGTGSKHFYSTATYPIESLVYDDQVGYIGISNESKYYWLSVTNETTFTEYNKDGSWVLTDVFGVKSGGGSSSGGSGYVKDTLFESSSSVSPVNLSNAYTDYDAILATIKYSGSIAGTYYTTAYFTSDQLVTDSQYVVSTNSWQVTFKVTDSTTFTIGSSSSAFLCKVEGLKFGGGSGGSGTITTGEIIDITPGDGTSSRTFTLDRTPKFVSMSWATDSSWRYHGSFSWGADRLYFTADNSSPKLSGSVVGVSTISYGQDGKSFTITGGNNGGCANTATTSGKMFVDYGEGTGGSGGSSDVHYSSTEQVIGTWIDGKPLYRKVITFSSDSSGIKQITLGSVSADLDEIITLDGKITEIGNRPIGGTGGNGTYNIDNYNCRLGYDHLSDSLIWFSRINEGWNKPFGHVIVTYTKSTDT